MKMHPVESSMLKAVGHDPATGKMRVQFHNGAVYEHDGVPLEKFAAFTGAASAGQFYNKKIKGQHEGRKIKGPGEDAE